MPACAGMTTDDAATPAVAALRRTTSHRTVERPMPPILAFDKVSKRFGAVIVAQAIDLAVAEGEALGIIGPNGAGKTTLFGIASGTVRPDAGRVIFAGSDITRLAPGTPLPHGHRPVVPDSAAVQRHDRVREPGCGGGVRRRAQRARRLSALRRTARAMRPRRQGKQAGRPAHAARPQAARTRPRAWRRSRGCCSSTRSPAA